MLLMMATGGVSAIPVGGTAVTLSQLAGAFRLLPGAVSSIVLFVMLLWRNDLKRFVISEYRKQDVAYLMRNSAHGYKL